jgi:glucan phosphoethanolaminetransferase (alkaline phosphatase superfamily)
MKKLLLSFALLFVVGICAINAQETKTKPVTTPSDKVHNVVHPHNKISHGTKYKHKTANDKKHVVTKKTANAEALKPKEKTEKKN